MRYITHPSNIESQGLQKVCYVTHNRTFFLYPFFFVSILFCDMIFKYFSCHAGAELQICFSFFFFQFFGIFFLVRLKCLFFWEFHKFVSLIVLIGPSFQWLIDTVDCEWLVLWVVEQFFEQDADISLFRKTYGFFFFRIIYYIIIFWLNLQIERGKEWN